MTDGCVVTLHLWGIPGRSLPRALRHMATDRVALRRTPGLLFAKSLGTGRGDTFGIRDADLRRWGLLTVWEREACVTGFEHGPVVTSWRQFADEQWTARLQPLSARGRWSGQEPFGRPLPRTWDGPVAAITRARLVLRRAGRFWRAVPPVSADLHRAPGLWLALGIGEAPVGLQGTFSVWQSSSALNGFAYHREAHAAVMARTASERWYAEELFARCALLGASGTINGVDPLASGRTSQRSG